jgi:hypothetical protein
MDPITMLGLAANVLQFVDFAAEIVSKGNAIRKSTIGALEDNAQLDIVCTRMQTLAADLKQSVNNPFAADDFALNAICRDCSQIAAKLHQKLSRLAASGSVTRFKSYRQALKSVWAKDAIDVLACRLKLFRGELNTVLLAGLRRKLDANASDQSIFFDYLACSQEANLGTQLGAIRIEHNFTNQIVNDQHEKTRRLILDAMFQMAQWGLSSRFPHGFGVNYECAKRQAKRLAPLMIAENLAFPMIADRFERIPEAYHKTFEWAWQRVQHESRPTCQLAEWLEHGEGLFWITGKAGSGKSTLMKFIRNDTRALQHLKVWAGSSHLVYGSFFFWKGGTALQKTQIGLLRSLLYCALHQQPELVNVVFPEKLKNLEQVLADHLYNAQIDAKEMPSVSLPAKYRILMEDWTLADLRNALSSLLRQKVINTKICFMIDGVDEFDGDHAEIVNMLQDVVKSRGVKICLSSRPLRVFERALNNCPGFRVQDLTKEDIREYIAGNLHQNHDMVDLMRKENHRATQLTKKIMEKASGVFLWVQLVVKSLLNGLMNQDTIKDLERRLELLPPDLEDLYRHMISTVDLLYRSRTFKFFYFVTCMDTNPLALLLSFFDEDLDVPIKAQIHLLPSSEEQKRVIDITARVTTACAGLLEVHWPLGNRDWSETRVEFMHRTVLDFFEKPDMQEELRSFSNDSPEQLDLALLGAFLLQLKWLLPPEETCTVVRDLWRIVQQFLDTASRADANGARLGTRLIDEFDRVVSCHWNAAFSSSTRNAKLPPGAAHWSNWIDSEMNIGLENSLLTHTIRYQLASYLSERYLHDPRGLQSDTSRPLLDVAIPPVHYFGFQAAPAPQTPSIPIVEILLQAGGDPNRVHNSTTPWTNALSQICDFHPDFSWNDSSRLLQWGQVWTQVLKQLLRCGADIHASIELASGLTVTTCSVAFIINVVLRQYDTAGADELRAMLVDKGIPAQEFLQVPQLPDSFRVAITQRSTLKNKLRVPFRLRQISTKPGERLDLYRAAHQGSI